MVQLVFRSFQNNEEYHENKKAVYFQAAFFNVTTRNFYNPLKAIIVLKSQGL
jgi:hypothetical protein